MSRPVWPAEINSGLQSWDGASTDLLRNLSSKPAALFRVSLADAAAGTLNTVWPPSQYEQCYASREVAAGVWKPIWSDGNNWLNLFDQSIVT